MRLGTPGFIGDRLRAAREARGIMAAAGLAEMLGISRAAVSQYENGDQTPSPAVMFEICEKLNLPIQHFLRKGYASSGGHFFRSLSAATKASRLRAQRKYEWLIDLVASLRQYVQFPAVDFPKFDLPSDPLEITDDMVDDAAQRLRAHWSLGSGPISNVVWLLENKGAVVVRLDLESEDVDAFSRWTPEDQRPCIILSTTKGAAARSRFNAAHELAHMVLHRDLDETLVSKKAVFQAVEHQAHRFSGEFLLPAESFVAELYAPSLDAMHALKKRWRVSIALMLKRAQDLRAIDEERAKKLWSILARRGWRRREPLDDTLPIEEPRFLPLCVGRLLDGGFLRQENISTVLGLNFADIEGLLNLPNGFLESHPSAVRIPEPSPRIISFPGSE